MGVYIKDLEIPENCTRCDYIGLNVAIGCPVMTGENGRAADCPLVEIKVPHGELIDRDFFRKEWHLGENCNDCDQNVRECEYDRIYSRMDFCGWLDDNPPVLDREDDIIYDISE